MSAAAIDCGALVYVMVLATVTTPDVSDQILMAVPVSPASQYFPRVETSATMAQRPGTTSLRPLVSWVQ